MNLLTTISVFWIRTMGRTMGVAMMAVLVLVGCSGGGDAARIQSCIVGSKDPLPDNESDLKACIVAIKKRPGAGVPPLPKVELPATFAYAASTDGLRDPFTPAIKHKSVENPQETSTRPTSLIHPDLNRNREELEGYPLDGLHMVGTLERNGARWGVVRSGDNKVFMVQIGNYMGQNHGRIEQITDTQILITEIIPDGDDGWKNRQASLTLSKQ